MAITSIYCPSCGAHNPVDAGICFACNHDLHEPVHETLLHNRYRLLDQLGSGGFGAVHRAEDTHEQGKIVAIKQINLAGLTPQQVIEATDGFNREVSLLSTLTHTHLPHIYEHFTDPDHWYLVMDFLEGETLETYLDKTYMKRGQLTPLPLTEVLDIGLQLCTVLDYLHTREPAIIFRDVKPANIMRTPAGTLYLIDFGIARYYKPGKPKDTIPFGSPGYAAPEQYGKAQTSPRSDIYSLGALLHMLLSGDDPVDNPFHFDQLRLYGGEGVHTLITLIECMVSLDAEQRPESVQKVNDILQRISDAENHARILPVVTTPPLYVPAQSVGTGGNGLQQMMMHRQQLRKQRQQYWSTNRRKSRRGFVIGAGGLLLAVGGFSALGYMTRNWNGSSSSEGNPPPSSMTITADALFETSILLTKPFSNGQGISNASWSIDGSLVALASGSTVQVQILYDSNPGGSHTLLTTQHISDAISRIAWNPHILTTQHTSQTSKSIARNPSQIQRTNMLAFTTATTLYLWDNLTAGNTQYARLHQIHAQEKPGDATISGGALAWSPNGKRIAIPFAEGIQIWDVETGTVFKNLPFSNVGAQLNREMPVSSLAWSSDGLYIAAALNGLAPIVWNVVTGMAYSINSDNTLLNAQLLTWSPNGNFLASSVDNNIYVTAFDMLSATYVSGEGSSNAMAGQVVYKGHMNTITALAWSPDGRYIASTSKDVQYNLHVWTPFNPGDGSPPKVHSTSLYIPTPQAYANNYIYYTTIDQQYTMLTSALTSVCWSPNGLTLLVGGDNAYIVPLNVALLG